MTIWKTIIRDKNLPVFVDRDNFTQEFARFCIQPIKRGSWANLADSLRYALFEQIPGAAATAVRFQYQSIQTEYEGRQKQLLQEILVNLDKVRLVTAAQFPIIATAKKKGPTHIHISDLQLAAPGRLLKAEQIIGSLRMGETVSVEILLHFGRGKFSAQHSPEIAVPKGWLLLERCYSPVRKLNCEMMMISTGPYEGCEQLILEITTDGSLSPEDALRRASHSLRTPPPIYASA